MKNLFSILFIALVFCSCSDDSSNSSTDDPQDTQVYDAPYVRSYATYRTTNSITLNGFIDHSLVTFSVPDTYKVGFVLRTGDPNDSSNDQIIELEGEVDYYNGFYKFNHFMDGLNPNTTYYYTAFTRNGDSEEDDWEEFTTSDFPCSYSQDNYYSINGNWITAYNPELLEPNCCDEGNVGIRFGNWPNIYEVNFNELDNGNPITAQYFGIDYMFDISYLQRELTKSTNQVLIGSSSTPETEVFVENNGVKFTIIFCNTVLRNGDILNGKVSVDLP